MPGNVYQSAVPGNAIWPFRRRAYEFWGIEGWLCPHRASAAWLLGTRATVRIRAMSTTPASAQLQPQPTPEPSAKMEYDRLIAYFDRLMKLTGLLLGLVISAAAVFLWKNTDDVKTQAAAAIKATGDNATREISDIGKAAQNTAKSEAQKAINAEFDRQNVQRMIEGTAQKKVDAAVETAVKRDLGAKVDAFRDFVIEIGEINNHGAQLRLDFRSGLDYLLKARENPDPAVRAYAGSTLSLIAADYENAVATSPTPPLDAALFTSTVPAQFSPKDLMRMIRTAQDPHGPMKIAVLFFTMKGKVGWDVPTLDLPAAEKWCAAHKPKCDE
jgi:citrate lyase gamma subunit